MLNIVSMTLLQTENPDLGKIMDQLSKSSLEFAEATYNLGALKVIFGIFAVFTILILLLFIYQVITLNQRINVIHEASVKTSEFFENTSDRSIGKVQAQVLIQRSFNGMSQNLKYSIIRIRLENHIDSRDLIIGKVTRLINNEFSELSAFYSNFIYNEKPLSEILDEADSDTVKDFILEQIYIPKENWSIPAMDQSVSIFLNGVKLNYIRNL